MTQVFGEDGSAIPVTVVELCPLTVTQVKTSAKEKYNAIQVGYVPAKAKHLSKAEQGHLTTQELPLFRHLQEFCVADTAEYKVGDTIDPSFIGEVEKVDVVGHSIGKGFQGTIKRWNQHRGPMSHGSKNHRLPGSIGAGTTPGRVVRGKKMAGNMGNERVTVRNLRMVKFLPEKNVLLIKGAVPGVEGGLLTIKPSFKL
jgi:large subunit ribosomal protein L3